MTKLSASAMTAFLESPKAFYWQYLHAGTGVTACQPSVAAYDHDLMFGTRWAEFVDGFYTGKDWREPFVGLQGDMQDWVPEKLATTYLANFQALMNNYHSCFSPSDGVRTPSTSELRLESERFVARLDGLSADGIIHECKATSRAPSLDMQLWKVENSIQVKLYAVLAKAEGIRIEFAYKDAPQVVFRAPVKRITAEQRARWSSELHALADSIDSCIARDPGDGSAFVCHTDCTLVTKRYVGACKWQPLCDATPGSEHFFKPRPVHVDERTGKELHIVRT